MAFLVRKVSGLPRNKPLGGNYKAEILARALVNRAQADLVILMQIYASFAYHKDGRRRSHEGCGSLQVSSS